MIGICCQHACRTNGTRMGVDLQGVAALMILERRGREEERDRQVQARHRRLLRGADRLCRQGPARRTRGGASEGGRVPGVAGEGAPAPGRRHRANRQRLPGARSCAWQAPPSARALGGVRRELCTGAAAHPKLAGRRERHVAATSDAILGYDLAAAGGQLRPDSIRTVSQGFRSGFQFLPRKRKGRCLFFSVFRDGLMV